MRKLELTLISLFIIFGLIAGCSKKEEGKSDVSEKKEVKITETTPIHLKYEIKGKQAGTADMFIKGKQFKMEFKVKEKGKEESVSMFMKDNVFYVITVEEGKKVGIKMLADQIEESMKDIMDLAKAKERLKDYTKEGTEEILGYKCDIYKKGDEKTYIYQDMIALKEVTGDEEIVATVFEPDAKISDSDFEPPKDIEYLDFNEIMKELK